MSIGTVSPPLRPQPPLTPSCQILTPAATAAVLLSRAAPVSCLLTPNSRRGMDAEILDAGGPAHRD